MTQPATPSSAPSVTFVTDIDRASHLIPGFLKKTLATDDKQWMTQFLNTLNLQGGPTAAEFVQEMAWVERSQQQLAEDAPSFDAQAGWQRMQGRLEEPVPLAGQMRPVKATSSAVAVSWVQAQIKDRISNAASWWKKPVVGVLASAMIVGQMGLLAAVVKHMNNLRPIAEVVTPSSGSQTVADSNVLSVAFHDTASLLEVRTLIDSVQGRVIGGPGALGIWEVAVPKSKLNEAVQTLSASKIVQSVAPQ